MIIYFLETKSISLQTDEKTMDEMIDNFNNTKKNKRGRFSHHQEKEMIYNFHVLSQSVFCNTSKFIKTNFDPYLRLISKEYNFHFYFLIYRPDYFSESKKC